jgi:hypothetical protein
MMSGILSSVCFWVALSEEQLVCDLKVEMMGKPFLFGQLGRSLVGAVAAHMCGH